MVIDDPTSNPRRSCPTFQFALIHLGKQLNSVIQAFVQQPDEEKETLNSNRLFSTSKLTSCHPLPSA